VNLRNEANKSFVSNNRLIAIGNGTAPHPIQNSFRAGEHFKLSAGAFLTWCAFPILFSLKKEVCQVGRRSHFTKRSHEGFCFHPKAQAISLRAWI